MDHFDIDVPGGYYRRAFRVSAVDLAVTRLCVDEGFRSSKYTDTTGHETIGYGFNIDAGITQTAAKALLAAQTAELAAALSAYAWSQGLDDTRMSVLIELAFNLGLNGLLHFPIFLTALGRGTWPAASDALLNSDAARQLPGRYNALAKIILTGVA